MSEYTMLSLLTQHPWLVGGLALLVLIILLTPYDLTNDTRFGFRRRYIRALLWSWEQSLGYARLQIPGLLRLQQVLLRGLCWLWGQACDRFLAGVRDMLRRWLG